MPSTPNIIMLHGWTNGDISEIPAFLPDNEQNWMGWTKRQLEDRGYTVETPFLQHGYKSEYKDWKKEIEKLDINENAILVGWSSGGAFWIRWLGETKQSIKKLILVAPAKVVGNSEAALKEIKSLEIDHRETWDRFHDFTCDTTIKDRTDNITIFISNDTSWLIEAAHIYADELSANLIKIENQGHFANHERPSPEFKELLTAITE